MSGISVWADYYVRAVRYDERSRLVDVIRVRPDNGGILGEVQEITRPATIKLIEAGVTFLTTPKDNEGRRFKGSHLHAVKIAGSLYIRIDANSVTEDDLGDLPVF